MLLYFNYTSSTSALATEDFRKNSLYFKAYDMMYPSFYKKCIIPKKEVALPVTPLYISLLWKKKT